MKSLFVMDPLDRIAIAGDSTYVTMRECSDRGYPVSYCVPSDLFVHDGHTFATATPVRTTADPPYFHPGEPTEVRLDHFDVVWMRKDPPFDMSYVLTAYLLDIALAGTLVVNDPRALMRFNEKLWTMRFPELHPETLLTSDMNRLRAFVQNCDKAVLKPWDGNGGRGVLVTGRGDRNLRSMIELLSMEGSRYVIAQRFIEGADQGDKRILLFDGEPVGQMLRVPSADDYRGNMHVGATVEACDLTERDREICDRLGPELRKWGMLFVGIDVISGYLTEINITSPTGIREINRLFGVKLEADLVDRVERARGTT